MIFVRAATKKVLLDAACLGYKMKASEKKQCPLRFQRDIYDRIREKAELDGMNYQQLGDLLFGAYLKGNREISRLVRRFTEEQKRKKGKNSLNEMEKSELFRLIETEHSPLGDLERAIKEQESEK